MTSEELSKYSILCFHLTLPEVRSALFKSSNNNNKANLSSFALINACLFVFFFIVEEDSSVYVYSESSFISCNVRYFIVETMKTLTHFVQQSH